MQAIFCFGLNNFAPLTKIGEIICKFLLAIELHCVIYRQTANNQATQCSMNPDNPLEKI